ncbi:carbonic anhydrase 13-like isoform X2 [Ruditapes philippinarum]|uniref:carbonic anhydrase 13-like isoform X2 n=1 Tax=Ruditapes philippinarum TaxID=129788 RepID=UPI00295ACC2A|nr:carbonic anhydrase 13-like isoform X2 [Ruditapes philippinarum]
MGKKPETCTDLYEEKTNNRVYKTVVEVNSKVENQQKDKEKKKETMSWGYSYSNGPHTWAVNYPDAAGHDQSPIDIHTGETIYDSDLATKPLTINYSEEDSFTACNTGSSFKVNISKTSELKDGPLTDVFRLEQFHLHWGSNDDHGSEHMIDGQSYAAELHLVHWNSTKYSNFNEAVNQPDGLAVLGIMIQSGAENTGFKDMVDTIRNVKKSGQTCQVLKSFNPKVLLPENTKEFWTYHGSLTTPPCYESVQWIVLRQPVQYSPNQLQALRSLLFTECEGECIVDNYRPPMPIGGRKIRASFQGTNL